MSATDAAWLSVTIPEGMGLEFNKYKWRQNLSHVEVYVKLPVTVTPKQVKVQTCYLYMHVDSTQQSQMVSEHDRSAELMLLHGYSWA